MMMMARRLAGWRARAVVLVLMEERIGNCSVMTCEGVLWMRFNWGCEVLVVNDEV